MTVRRQRQRWRAEPARAPAWLHHLRDRRRREYVADGMYAATAMKIADAEFCGRRQLLELYGSEIARRCTVIVTGEETGSGNVECKLLIHDPALADLAATSNFN